MVEENKESNIEYIQLIAEIASNVMLASGKSGIPVKVLWNDAEKYILALIDTNQEVKK
jgi:hypothetical protein